MKTCTNTYVQKASMLTEQEVKMKLFYPKALNFEKANVPLASQKQWKLLSEVIASYTAPLWDELSAAEQECSFRNEMLVVPKEVWDDYKAYFCHQKKRVSLD